MIEPSRLNRAIMVEAAYLPYILGDIIGYVSIFLTPFEYMKIRIPVHKSNTVKTYQSTAASRHFHALKRPCAETAALNCLVTGSKLCCPKQEKI
jgi:hypothetical protein